MSETVIVAIITAVSTSLPTIIGIIINNRYQLSSKRLEINYSIKQQTINNFVDASINFIYSTSDNYELNKKEYYDKLLKIYSCFGKNNFTSCKDIGSNSLQNLHNLQNTLIDEVEKVVNIASKLLFEK